MGLMTRIADKTGALGSIVSAMGCAACFPAIVFAATVWLLGNWWTANLMYVGLALMIGVSIWDFVSPAHRRCGPDGCELPAKQG
ncbi:MAG: hypothetical protein Q7L55_03015 [Actinomycetota bacterium]|nr:hypothetical protein [Actinomycetota bacterium]